MGPEDSENIRGTPGSRTTSPKEPKMKIRENFGAANSKRCIFVLGSVPYDYDGHPKQASIFLFCKLENFDTCSVYVSFVFLINRILVNIAKRK